MRLTCKEISCQCISIIYEKKHILPQPNNPKYRVASYAKKHLEIARTYKDKLPENAFRAYLQCVRKLWLQSDYAKFHQSLNNNAAHESLASKPLIFFLIRLKQTTFCKDWNQPTLIFLPPLYMFLAIQLYLSRYLWLQETNLSEMI